MNKEEKTILAVVLVYLLGFALTYGWVRWNDIEPRETLPEIHSFMYALVWPAYWPLHLSSELFRPEPPK